jgi:hypothetical protein
MSAGSSSPPSARIVTPDPPVNSVKNAHNVAAATAVPPGIQPNSARSARRSRSDDFPSASRNPVSVKSGIAARFADGDVSSSNALMSGTIGRLPSVKNAIMAMPPSSAKMGAPSTPAMSMATIQGSSARPSKNS